MANERPSLSVPPGFRPYIPPESHLPEFTARAVIVGAILGVIFGASSLYLVLKVGLTVSASIPIAVVSIALFRLLSKAGIRDATVLENNIVQTTGSAGESIAFGVGVTMPAILILGFDLELWRVLLVATLGALLGILMMIPLRRALIVEKHGQLKYPEGTACAVVLRAGASPESRAAAGEASGTAGGISAHTIFTGFGIGLAYKSVMVALKGWREVPEKIFGAPFTGASVSAEISPELLGVGYIIGPRIGAIMCGGGVLAYLLLIPLIKFFGENLPAPLPPGTTRIADMSPAQVRSAYILYIGAGAVAAGGIISLLRALPTIWHGLREGLRGFDRRARAVNGRLRTDRDLSMRFVLGGIVALIAAIMLAPPLHMNLLGALLMVGFGFLFVTVSSQLTGQIGSTSNPISGMTIATLLFTCLVFLVLGWTGGTYYVTALSVGAIVCTASSNAGNTSQDLKTGFLIGATPRYQQIALFIGALASALVQGPILLQLNDAATVYVPASRVAPEVRTDPTRLTKTERVRGPQAAADSAEYRVWHKTDTNAGPAGKYLVDNTGRAVYLVDPGINGVFTERPDGTPVRKFDAPKATLVSYIIKGILDRQLPWGLVLFGVIIALMLEMTGIPSLAFAVGVYLPLSTSLPIFIGGAIRGLVDWQRGRGRDATKTSAEELAAEGDRSPGVLMACGYIAGGAIAGIIIAFLAGVLEPVDRAILGWSRANNPFFEGAWSNVLALIPFALLVITLYWAGNRRTMR